MLENLVWTVLGWLIGYLMPSSFWDTRWVKDARTRRQQKTIEATLRKAAGHLEVGGYRFDQIATVQVFEPPLKRSEVVCSFNAETRQLPLDLQELERSYLPSRIDELKQAGRTVDLNDRYALRKLRIERPQMNGRRRNRPELIFEASNFKYYLMLNDALDKPLLPESDGTTTIRDRHLAQHGPFEWQQLEVIPIHPQFATVTAVTTNDDLLVPKEA